MSEQRLFVYVELGIEKDYTRGPQDNSDTNYKRFSGCKVYASRTEEDCDSGTFLASEEDVTVIIYC